MKTIESNISNEIDTGFKQYSMYTVENRAIPSAIDGVKPSARKLIYAMLKDYPTRKVKVAELAGSISKCVGPETKIMINGKTITVAELYDTFNNNDKIKAFDLTTNTYCDATIYGVYKKEKTTMFYSVTTENGVVTVTGEHLFLKSSGEWIAAKDLNENDELM